MINKQIYDEIIGHIISSKIYNDFYYSITYDII